jgi:hypothetical protein
MRKIKRMKRVRWRKGHMMEKLKFNNVTVPDITVRWMEDGGWEAVGRGKSRNSRYH